MTDFYDHLINMRDSRTQADYDSDQLLMENLQKMAEEDAIDPNNYYNTQGKNGSVWWIFDKIKRIIKIRKLVTIRAYKFKRNHGKHNK